MNAEWPPQIDGIPVPYGSAASELRALVSAEHPECWVAIVALARSSELDALAHLGELASSADPYIRRFAVQWIGRRHDGAQLGRVILERLSDPNEYVVRTALQVAGQLALAETHSVVLTLLKHPLPSTRQAALRALETLWRDEDWDALLALFRTDASEEVRRTAAWTLRELRSADRAAILFDLWREDPLPRHRLWACDIARQFPERSFQERLTPLCEDSDGHVRKAARRALEVIKRSVELGNT